MLALLAMSMQVQSMATAPLPPPQRYRLDVTMYNEIDQTVIGQQKLIGGMATTAYVVVSMADTVGGQLAIIKIDSISRKPSGLMVAEMQKQTVGDREARGATIRLLTVDGHPAGPPHLSDPTNSALVPVAQSAGLLFPPLRRDMKVGRTWTDTSHVNNANATQKQTGEIIVNWTVTGIQPGGALVFDGVTTTHTKTEDSKSGQTMTVTGRTKQHVVLPVIGPARQVQVEAANENSTTAPQLPGAIPGKSSGTMVITPIP